MSSLTYPRESDHDHNPLSTPLHISKPPLRRHSKSNSTSHSHSHSHSKSPSRHSFSRSHSHSNTHTHNHSHPHPNGPPPSPLPPVRFANAPAPPVRPATTPLPSPLTRPPIVSRAQSSMYSPQQWGGMLGGQSGQGYNPYMMGSPAQSMAGGGAASVSHRSQTESTAQPYDSAKMKQGRMGHYGYLEGRELAGPPVGYMPAGIQPQMASGANQISPSRAASTMPPNSTAYYPARTGAGSVAGSSGTMAWGDQGNNPRARYDGSSTAQGYVQADLDTPYPRTAGGGASSAFTRYGPDGSIANGIDGRMGIGHRRMREGRV